MMRCKAFTLIEVMIIVSIIMILLAVAYPAYQKHLEEIKSEQQEESVIYDDPWAVQPEQNCITVDGKVYCEVLDE